MLRLTDALATFDAGPLGTIEHKYGQKRLVQETRASEEQSAELGILALFAIFGMIEPNGSVDAYSEPS